MSEQDGSGQSPTERRRGDRRRNAEMDFGTVERRKGERRSERDTRD